MVKIKQELGDQKKTGRGLVLIIEDDDFLKSMITQRLKTEGFEVAGAAEGKIAFGLIKDEMPTLIILDLLLPGADGFQILREIRQDTRLQGVPVVVLSNLGEPENIDKAKVLGADDYLIKAHFTLGEIIEKVNQLVLKK